MEKDEYKNGYEEVVDAVRQHHDIVVIGSIGSQKTLLSFKWNTKEMKNESGN